MNIKIQVRRGTETEWSTTNPVLSAGELGYDTTNQILKVGDGSSTWLNLPEVDNQTAEHVIYDNTRSGLGSEVTDVQVAIDTIEGRVANNETDISTAQSDITMITGTGEGSIAKALQDSKDYTDGEVAVLENRLDIIEGGQNVEGSIAFLVNDGIQSSIAYTDGEIAVVEGRLDIIEGNDETAGSIAKALADAKDYADNEIILAKTALGTNFVVDNIAERDALTDLTIGDNVFVNNAGNNRWAQFKVINDDPLTFTKIMDQTILINAIDGPGIKAAYESNEDTNAFTDERLSDLTALKNVTLNIASKAQAEEGTNNGKYMTPLRTAEAIAFQTSALLTSGSYITQSDLDNTIASIGGDGLIFDNISKIYDLDYADNQEAAAGSSTVKVLTPATAQFIVIDGGEFN